MEYLFCPIPLAVVLLGWQVLFRVGLELPVESVVQALLALQEVLVVWLVSLWAVVVPFCFFLTKLLILH